MTEVERVKAEGVRKALFDGVNSRLWAAKMCIEGASETRDAQYIHFAAKLKAARERMQEAEDLFAELCKVTGKKK